MFNMRKFLDKFSYFPVEEVSDLLAALADADDDELFVDDPPLLSDSTAPKVLTAAAVATAAPSALHAIQSAKPSSSSKKAAEILAPTISSAPSIVPRSVLTSVREQNFKAIAASGYILADILSFFGAFALIVLSVFVGCDYHSESCGTIVTILKSFRELIRKNASRLQPLFQAPLDENFVLPLPPGATLSSLSDLIDELGYCLPTFSAQQKFLSFQERSVNPLLMAGNVYLSQVVYDPRTMHESRLHSLPRCDLTDLFQNIQLGGKITEKRGGVASGAVLCHYCLPTAEDATIRCESCDSFFCSSCSEKIHTTAVFLLHKRVEIRTAAPNLAAQSSPFPSSPVPVPSFSAVSSVTIQPLSGASSSAAPLLLICLC
jgi:hypothetical protein